MILNKKSLYISTKSVCVLVKCWKEWLVFQKKNVVSSFVGLNALKPCLCQGFCSCFVSRIVPNPEVCWTLRECLGLGSCLKYG